jgi:hypothetical protein
MLQSWPLQGVVPLPPLAGEGRDGGKRPSRPPTYILPRQGGGSLGKISRLGRVRETEPYTAPETPPSMLMAVPVI